MSRSNPVEQSSQHFLANADEALSDLPRAERRDIMAAFTPLIRTASIDAFAQFEETRQHVKHVRQHTLQYLAHYLEAYEREAIANGNHVHYARDSSELNSIVLDICQQNGARRIAKGKSMVTEETGLTAELERAGLDVVETDLGEYIVQQAGETPSHIVGPALHKSRDEIKALFLEKHRLGERELDKTEELVEEARTVLRQHFLEADAGIIGANALIAENGYSMLVTNEGNGDLCANLPPLLIICTTIDRILPRAEDASAMQRLLVRSATGQSQTCYTSFYSGPRRASDPDGPLQTHVVLLDNTRSEILDSEFSEILECMRCGACLNHCPIYQSAGGHAYGWVYPGPVGSVLTPLLTSLEASHALPNACTSCGRCEEVCPADIPLPAMLRDLRAREHNERLSPARWRAGIALHAWLSRHPGLYRLTTSWTVRLLHMAGKRRGVLSSMPFAAGWSSQRDFPAPQADTFMHRHKRQTNGG